MLSFEHVQRGRAAHQTSSRFVLMLLMASAAGLWPRAAAAQPSIDELMERTGQYVEDFVNRFANIVAEERYEQTTTSPRRRRRLVSDFLLVKLEGTNQFYQFRDVLEVDDTPVRGRDERLTQLFLQPWDTAIEQAMRIAQEGTRHNLADIGTINYPLVALSFLQVQYRDRLRFSLGRREEDLGPDVWLVNYEERAVPTFFRRQTNRDLPMHGRLWLEETTGRVVKTELKLGTGSAAPEVITVFELDDDLQLNVPVEMRDWYPGTQFGDLSGTATYGRFRRFEVHTDEAFRERE